LARERDGPQRHAYAPSMTSGQRARLESGPGGHHHGAGPAAAGTWQGRRRGSRTWFRPEHDQRSEGGRWPKSGLGKRRH
jgi:hypothetical protein